MINKLFKDYTNSRPKDIFIHYNNNESTYFEDNENIDYIKIFFSGGTTSIKEYPEENEYYVPQAHLPSFIKNKLNGLVGI